MSSAAKPDSSLPGGIVGKAITWVDDRFPLVENWKAHLSEYYAPKNFNFWYYFGSLAMLVLVLQIITGIFLTMNYKPDAALAFASVEYIMRDVPWGWLIRYMHSTGASMSSSWCTCTCSVASCTAPIASHANSSGFSAA